jgi:phosphoribosylglycinamide formyltransferase-1
MRPKRVAVIISGNGSNMKALVKAALVYDYPAKIALVISNRVDAKGLRYAQVMGVRSTLVDHKHFGSDREAFERALQVKLDKHEIEIVCLAGFMRLLTPWLVDRWKGRMLNIHPALLPSFKGLATHERALAAGVKIHGATVHFVTSEMDSGPIIVQGATSVLDTDTPETLAARVLKSAAPNLSRCSATCE